MTQIEHALAALQAQVNAQQSHQATGPSQRHEEPALEAAGGPDSARKSNVASMENVQPTLEMAGLRYPVDEITESEHAELHVRLMGLSIKVAVGYALPPVAGGTYHCRPIPDGYAIVGVDEVVKEYEEAQLDHATGEGETQLKFAVKTTILWKKEHIVLPNWRPLAPPPSPQRQQSEPLQLSPAR